MSDVTLTVKEPRREWIVYDGKEFKVQVCAWPKHEWWGWNVYALIFDGHPLHKNVEAALGLHFHWGATYDKRIVTTEAQGNRYEWQRDSDVLKIGSDYQHYEDSRFESADPTDGIPGSILYDAQILAQELAGRMAPE